MPYLGPVKRAQALECLGRFDAYLALRQRHHSDHRLAVDLVTQLRASSYGPRSSRLNEARAWAAGLFDGDGSFDFSVSGDAALPSSTGIRAAVSQSSASGIPEVLTRFRAIVGFGGIYGPYYRGDRVKPKYAWTASTYAEVEALTDVLGRNLSAAKRRQAAHAMDEYRAVRGWTRRLG